MATDTESYGEAFNAAVAAELRAARSRQRISYPTLVEATGIPRNTLLRYLNGQRDIPMPAFGRIARALNLSPGDVLDSVDAELRKQQG